MHFSLSLIISLEAVDQVLPASSVPGAVFWTGLSALLWLSPSWLFFSEFWNTFCWPLIISVFNVPLKSSWRAHHCEIAPPPLYNYVLEGRGVSGSSGETRRA